MGDMGSWQAEEDDDGGIHRRSFLIKAAIAGTAAIAVPTIVSVSPAGASTLVSPPPKPPTDPGEPVDPTKPEAGPPEDPPTEVRGITEVQAQVAPSSQANASTVSGAQLPLTGVEVKDLVAGGLAATAGGAALMLWSADRGKVAQAAANLLGVTPPNPPPS